MNYNLWDNISFWQKWTMIISIIVGSVVFLYPRCVTLKEEVNNIIECQKRSKQIDQDLEKLNDYIQVLGGILKSNLQVIDDKTYGTIINVNGNPNLIEVKLRKTQNNDIFVFVTDSLTGIYYVSFDDSGNYSYIDFNNEYHLIYEVNIKSNTDK